MQPWWGMLSCILTNARVSPSHLALTASNSGITISTCIGLSSPLCIINHSSLSLILSNVRQKSRSSTFLDYVKKSSTIVYNGMHSTRHRSRDLGLQQVYSEALTVCKTTYENKEYAQSIQTVDAALRAHSEILQPSEKIELLDVKCLSYVRLNDLELALEAARTMVRLNKSAGVGYCRIASIEKARLNYAVAVQFLDHGCTRVTSTDKYFDHLMSQRVKLKALAGSSIVMSKATDPMNVLPLELVRLVLLYLDYRQVVALLRVSKSWKRTLCRLEPIYDTLDFRKSLKQISYSELRAALNRIGQPKMMAIDKLSTPAGDVLSKKILPGPKWLPLEHLVLNDKIVRVEKLAIGKWQLKTIHLGLDTKISIDNVLKILDQCRSLKEAVFRRVAGSCTESMTVREKLEVLELGNAFDLAAFAMLPRHFSNYPNLQCLTVNGGSLSSRSTWDLRQNTKLVKLDIYACVLRAIHLPQSLEQWLWDGTETASFNLWNTLDIPPTELPNLRTICFSGDNAIMALNLLQASKVVPGQLRRVGLHHRQNGDLWTAKWPILDLLSGVEDFSFESESLLDTHLPRFVDRYPNVVTLQLAAPRITGSFIVDLLTRPDNRVRKLILKDCAKVQRDAVDWARSQGVDVEVHGAKIEVRGGRRLREGWF